MKIVAMVLAGGEGTRLYPLTAEQAKPALPFANGYRIIDFVLSNLLNSGITSIYVLALLFSEPVSEPIALGAVLHAAGVIERLVLALPPIDPDPAGAKVLRLPRRR